MDINQESLEYHIRKPKGKISVVATKPCSNQHELSMAYTPGVAEPCRRIHADVDKVWDYTFRGNAVAVVSDGTAVLGLGDIGPEAGLPVMEGKAVLFKTFADVDAFPICINRVKTEEGKPSIEKIIETTERLEPTFGGINLEDIKAPECFEIEQRLKQTMGIPVFHDDQHGTAIITLAGMLNGLEMVGKDIADVKVVFSGAGASAMATAKYYISAGAKKENVLMCDSRGVIYKGRTEGMNKYKEYFANETDARALADALDGADIFVGLSVGGLVSTDMASRMADKAIIYAMANPDPEITPADAKEAGAYIIGTGRSDYPNQINNVLGFPGIFRGALDVRASDINEEMKFGASRALAEIAKEPIPSNVKGFLSKAYPEDAANGMFDGGLSRDYVIPKPIDPRVVPRVARYVAEAAMKSGMARVRIDDLDAYENEVMERVRSSRSMA